MSTQTALDVLQNLGTKVTDKNKRVCFLRGRQLFATFTSFHILL